MSDAHMLRTKGPGALDRRRFLKGSVLGALSVGAGSSAASTENSAEPSWDLETEVLVVGSGAAGSCAALAAQDAGARVTLLEKASFPGGTTLKSQGIYWIPNNTQLRNLGAEDPREDALRYMARVSYPQQYDADAAKLGLPDRAYDLIAAYYDNASRVVDWLHEIGALTSSIFYPGPGHGPQLPDYYSHLPEGRDPKGGRALAAATQRGEAVWGSGLIAQLRSVIEARGIPSLLSHRASRLVMREGRVTGLVAENASGAAIRIRVLRGVVLATGGFTHNAELTSNFLRGPIVGGCAMPAAEGDAIAIAGEVGAALGNMNNAWWTQVLLEEAARNSEVGLGVFNLPGAAMIQVNRHGRRFVSEKAPYNERTQAQFVWDTQLGEFQNLVGIMIYDADAAWETAGAFPIPETEASHVIRGETLAELEAKLRQRLAKLSGHTGGIQLSQHFGKHLGETLARFAEFAEAGIDEDFHRGETPIEKYFQNFTRHPDKEYRYPNASMQPLAKQGPYYAILLGPGVLDTKGGPVIDARGRVLDVRGEVIPGLFGAGNCIASPAGAGYWGGGGTIGPAMTFGALAGESAAQHEGAGGTAMEPLGGSHDSL
ncbi:MAG: FAD-dependent oxidoreductase [Deltaproteobacteria bacterium]|nr:FAD-dependent oxidoreductase [Deltaproteobacteria bacterium]